MAAGEAVVLHVGGVEQQADEETVRGAFEPFGPLLRVVLPRERGPEGEHRGFALVEFEDKDDAAEAVFNMDGSELFGRTLRVGVSRKGGALKGRAVWEALPEDGREAEAAAAAAAAASAAAGSDEPAPEPPQQ